MYIIVFCSNCVHRDLAARNILVRDDENKKLQTKVADFGLSRYKTHSLPLTAVVFVYNATMLGTVQ